MEHATTRWSSSVAYVFAAIAAAIGLGNIWRFPYLAGENGGGAFVLIYIAFVIILGIPLLASEAALGRIGRQNPAASFRDIAIKTNRSPRWKWVGMLAVLTSLLLVSYYVVIASWIVDYLLQAVSGHFIDLTETESQAGLDTLFRNPWGMLGYTSLLMLASIAVIVLGIKQGLERLMMFMFPAMFVLIFVLLGYAMTTGSFAQGLDFMFRLDFAAVNTHVVLMALGQAFFSLNVALGITLTFSAYVPNTTPIGRSVTIVALADTFVAIIAGLIIFPIVFANGMAPDQGPSLAFKTLPLAFGGLPFSIFFASLFFLMLLFAAFTSVVSLLEVSVAWVLETFRMTRAKSTILVGIATWILSLGTIGSFSYPEKIQLFGVTFFQASDFMVGSIMLPLGGLLMAIFVGWYLPKYFISDKLNWDRNSIFTRSWVFINRFIAPIAILLIFLAALDII